MGHIFAYFSALGYLPAFMGMYISLQTELHIRSELSFNTFEGSKSKPTGYDFLPSNVLKLSSDVMCNSVCKLMNMSISQWTTLIKGETVIKWIVEYRTCITVTALILQ